MIGHCGANAEQYVQLLWKGRHSFGHIPVPIPRHRGHNGKGVCCTENRHDHEACCGVEVKGTNNKQTHMNRVGKAQARTNGHSFLHLCPPKLQ